MQIITINYFFLKLKYIYIYIYRQLDMNMYINARIISVDKDENVYVDGNVLVLFPPFFFLT